MFVFGHFLLLRARFKESATTSDKDKDVYEEELFDCSSTAIGSMYRRLRGLDECLQCIFLSRTPVKGLLKHVCQDFAFILLLPSPFGNEGC